MDKFDLVLGSSIGLMALIALSGVRFGPATFVNGRFLENKFREKR